MQHISSALSEGDIRLFEKTIAAAQRDPSLWGAVIFGLNNNDFSIRRLFADAVKMIGKKHLAYLDPYKEIIIEHAINDELEIRMSLIPLLPRLPLDEQERATLFARLGVSLVDASDMQQIVALQALITLAESDPALRPQAIVLLEEQAVSGILANQSLARYQLTQFITSSAVMESQRNKHTSFRERWQQIAPMWTFNNQYIKVATNHYRSRKKQEQERAREAPPTKKQFWQELSTIFYAIIPLLGGVVLIEQFSLGFAGRWDYIMLILGIGSGLLGIWGLSVSAKNLVQMGMRYRFYRGRSEIVSDLPPLEK